MDAVQDEVPVSQEIVAEDTQASDHKMTINCTFMYFLRGDGMWLKVGDFVHIEGSELTFIVCRMYVEDGCVYAKLVNVHNSDLRRDFVINCNVNYVICNSGGKVSLKKCIKEKVEQDAYVEFCNFISCDVSVDVKVKLRRMVLGHAMRVGLQCGFGNLSCIRVS